MTIDLHKKDRAYFSSFKTISRDKREYEENVSINILQLIPIYRK